MIKYAHFYGKLDKTPLWFGKLVNYEFWPIWLFYFPISFYIIYLAIKARSATFFANVNPCIKDSGIYKYSKWSVLQHIPCEYKPKGQIIQQGDLTDKIIQDFTFPLIAKPDMGERGKGVALIQDATELKNYAVSIQQNFILQEYCDFPEEAAIFYVRKPSEKKGRITSFATKEFLSVIGDGKSTVFDLMSSSFRARLQIHRQKEDFLKTVPAKGEKLILEVIGNHSRGTRFINANHLISEPLTDVFDQISKSIPDFFYGRYDLKFKNISDLEAGKNFKIVELNGINSEPAHIYDQSTGLFNAYKDCLKHYTYIYEISEENSKAGHQRSHFWPFWKSVIRHST